MSAAALDLNGGHRVDAVIDAVLRECREDFDTLPPAQDPFTEACELRFSLDMLLPRLTLDQTRRVVAIVDAMAHGRV